MGGSQLWDQPNPKLPWPFKGLQNGFGVGGATSREGAFLGTL